MQSANLTLIPHTGDSLRAILAGNEAYEKQSGFRVAPAIRELIVSDEVSPDYLARVQLATSADPWVLGFAIVLTSENIMIGMCGYKGPPMDGHVEIAYGIAPEYRGKGYATEVAALLTGHAFESDKVSIVRAHTLPERNASCRVLTKCGFKLIGEVNDPEDGPVWRWEKERARSQS